MNDIIGEKMAHCGVEVLRSAQAGSLGGHDIDTFCYSCALVRGLITRGRLFSTSKYSSTCFCDDTPHFPKSSSRFLCRTHPRLTFLAHCGAWMLDPPPAMFERSFYHIRDHCISTCIPNFMLCRFCNKVTCCK
jgi:hypothetical protein